MKILQIVVVLEILHCALCHATEFKIMFTLSSQLLPWVFAAVLNEITTTRTEHRARAQKRKQSAENFKEH